MTPPPSEANLMSGSPEKAMATMLGVMMGLKDLYKKETAAMKSRDVTRFLNLQPAKEAYTRDYEMLVKELQARSSTIKKSDSPLRERLVAEQHELAVLAEESMSWSLRMADSMRRVQERLINAAREAIQSEKTNYGAAGTIDAPSGKMVPTAFSEAY